MSPYIRCKSNHNGLGLLSPGNLGIITANTVEDRCILEMKIAARMKNILFCSISHELRSPINHVNGMLEVIKSKVDDSILRYVKIAMSSCNMLKSKIDDILDYSMLEASS